MYKRQVDALRCSVNVQKDAADILMGINWAGIAENLNQAVSALYDSMDSFRQAAVLLGDASEQLRQVLMILADRQPEVETDRKLLEDKMCIRDRCKAIDSCHKISIVSGDSGSGAAAFFRNLFYRAVDNRIDFFLKETFHILVADGMQRA